MNVRETSISETEPFSIPNLQVVQTRHDSSLKKEFFENVFENESNYTKDSSLSSTCSRSYKSNVTNISACKSHDHSQNSNISASHVSKTAKHSNKSILSNEDTSDKEEIVKLTKTISLELLYTTKLTPPQLRECPEMVRSNFVEIGRGAEPDLVLQEIRQRSIQFQCDRNKILSADFMEDFGVVDPSQYRYGPAQPSPVSKYFYSRAIQTYPVLILPLDCRDKVTETEKRIKVKNEQCQVSPSGDPRMISDLNLQKSERHTQTYTKWLTRSRTNSEANSYSKGQKVTSKNAEGNSLSRAIWGDVYNDYRQMTGVSKGSVTEKTPILRQRPFSAKSSKESGRKNLDSMNTGDGTEKLARNILRFRRSFIREKSDPIHNLAAESSKNSTVSKASALHNKLSNEGDKSQDVSHFQKCFQVQPFDEMVKSFLTPSDRRVRAVCSRMKCRIRMLGPTRHISPDSKSVFRPSIYDKSMYQIIISSDSKERLEKSLRCVQETFPKACLSERASLQPNLEVYGEEVPS